MTNAQKLAQFSAEQRSVVVVCFGTMSIPGDSLGPQVGSLLQQKYKLPAFVYGTEQHTVNGKNMKQWTEFIKAAHSDAVIVAVDASLGQPDKVGQVIIRSDGVCPAAIRGRKTRFGDIGVLAVVAENSGDPLMQLMSVSPLYISKLADKISIMIASALSCDC